MTTEDNRNNNPALNITLGVISLVCAIGGATGLIPIWEQWQRIIAYTEAVRADDSGVNVPERPDPKAPGPFVLLTFFTELAALITGGNVVVRIGGRNDEMLDTSGLRLAAAGALGACGVLLVLYIGALAFAFVGLTTWW